MKVKRLIAASLSVLMVIGSLAACGSSGSSSTSTTAAAAPAETTAAAATTAAAPAETKAAEPAADAKPVQFTINSGLVEMRDDVVKKFVNDLSEKSGGRIKGQILEAGVMGSETESRQACIDGTITVSFNNVFNYAPMDWQWLPGAFKDYDDVKKLAFDPEGEIWQYCIKADEQAGLHMIGMLDNGFRYMAAVKEPLNTVDAITGAKVRIPNFPTVLDWYNNIQAIPAIIDHSEVASGLQQGMIAAADNAIYNYLSMGIQEMVHYITPTTVWGFGLMSVNKDFWDQLSPEDQALFEEVGQDCSEFYLQYYQDKTNEAVEKYTGNGTWEMCPPEDDLLARYEECTEQTWKQYVESHPDQADWIATLSKVVGR